MAQLVTKLISGGQIGADIAGLRAGQRLSIETGGWMPPDFRTKDGNHPEYAEMYGVREHECQGYPPRTFANVEESDGTIRFAYDFSSPGEVCTLKAIQRYEKPHLDVFMDEHPDDPSEYYISSFTVATGQQWLMDNDISVINIAGNANAGVESAVENFLVRLVSRHNNWFTSNFPERVAETNE